MESNLELPVPKKVKKSSSVRFAPEKSSNPSIAGEEENPVPGDDNIDILAEIHNCLPSNTLHRRKQTVFAPTINKSFTLPREGDTSALGHTIRRMRLLSYPNKKKSVYSQHIDTSDTPKKVPTDAPDEQILLPDTEEEKVEELLNIRNLPIPMREKKMYSRSSDDIDARLACFEAGQQEPDEPIKKASRQHHRDSDETNDFLFNRKHTTYDKLPYDHLKKTEVKYVKNIQKEFDVCSVKYGNIAVESRKMEKKLDDSQQKFSKKKHSNASKMEACSLFPEHSNKSDTSDVDTDAALCNPPENFSFRQKSYNLQRDYHEDSLDPFFNSRKARNNKTPLDYSEQTEVKHPVRNLQGEYDVHRTKLGYIADENRLVMIHDSPLDSQKKFSAAPCTSKMKAYSWFAENSSIKPDISDANSSLTSHSNSEESHSKHRNEIHDPLQVDFSYPKRLASSRKKRIFHYSQSSQSHINEFNKAKSNYVKSFVPSKQNIPSTSHKGIDHKYRKYCEPTYPIHDSSNSNLLNSEEMYMDFKQNNMDCVKECYHKNLKDYNQSKGNENTGIKRRQNARDGEMSTAFDDPWEYRNVSKRSKIKTFTMHDACKIAPVFRSSNSHTESICDVQNTDETDGFRNRRKCWSRSCWSTTKHSHASLSNQVESLTKKRTALVNSMKSPLNGAKSQKKKFSDYLSSCFKTSFSRFKLWNSTLKKIEGQFGTGVVSYFVLLRWLIILNFVIFILYFLVIILPYSAFALLPRKSISMAPNTSLLTEEYLQRFPKYRNAQLTKRSANFRNISVNIDGDLLSNLGSLLDDYVPEEIIDVTVRYSKRNYTDEERLKYSLLCEDRYKEEMRNRTKDTLSFLQDFLQGTGWLQSTILFLGFYPDRDISYFGLPYNLPVSFLAVLFVSFLLSIGLMLQFSSHGIQENILTRKSDYLTFSNMLFCSWDYCIEDKKTAAIRHKSITCEIKSNLAEEHRKLEIKSWSSKKKINVYILRVVINILVIMSLLGCFYLIYRVVNIQLENQKALADAGAKTLLMQFLSPLVITGLNIIMPIIFYNVVKFEMYDTRTQVNMALFRIVFLRLASVFVLVSSLHKQITCEPKDECKAGKSNYCRSPLCWETYVGQELYKLVITDFFVYIFMFLGYDLPRDFIVQKCKCKLTEIIGRQVFDLPSQVLSLVYSQTLCWLGLFYSPLLAGISVLKFLILFYVKKLVVLKHCTPAPVLYKTSRSNSIFMTILMISFFVVTVIHGYSLSSIEPSPGCSPFRRYHVIINAIPDAISNWSPIFVDILSFLFSAFFFIPSFFLLSIIIYYYWTIVVAHRKMTKVLKAQIAVEGRDKQFLLNRLADAARQAISN